VFAKDPIITVRQPYASLIVRGEKDVENRTWQVHHRGGLWIHSAVRRADTGGEDDPRGVILGHVQLVDVVKDATSGWAIDGQFHWLLALPFSLAEPIPARGQMNLWYAPDLLAEELERRGIKLDA
jgi:hypothetical protein